MAFSYSPDLDEPVSRVRYAVGDISAPGIQPDAVYEALLAAAGDDEATAIRTAAAGLAAWAATQPSSLSSDGSSLSWAERIKQWNAIALGEAGSTQPTAGGTARSARLARLSAGSDYCPR
jgi:hypothetical protein